MLFLASYHEWQRTCINLKLRGHPLIDVRMLRSTLFSGVVLNRFLDSFRYLIEYGTVSAKIAPRLKCYKNASRLNRYNFPMDNAIDSLFSTLHTTPFHYEILKIGSIRWEVIAIQTRCIFITL